MQPVEFRSFVEKQKMQTGNVRNPYYIRSSAEEHDENIQDSSTDQDELSLKLEIR